MVGAEQFIIKDATTTVKGNPAASADRFPSIRKPLSCSPTQRKLNAKLNAALSDGALWLP